MKFPREVRIGLRRILRHKTESFVAISAAVGLDPSNDFVGADLRHVDFGTDDLSYFNFCGADLTGSKLWRAHGLDRVIVDSRTKGWATAAASPASRGGGIRRVVTTSTPIAIRRIAVERHLPVVLAELGQADMKRIAALPPLMGEDGRIGLREALAALFPGQDRTAAMTSFQHLRARIVTAAADARVRLTLEVGDDSCWFAGDEGTAEAAAQFTEAETRNVVRIKQMAVQVGKRSVRYFISYAHADAALKTKLMSLLGQWFDAAKDYVFIPWQDGDILVGSDWHDQIQQAIKVSDLGLLLVSPAFLASQYIPRGDLQHFIAPDPLSRNPDQLAVPVALRGLRFDGSMDMKGLEARQIFLDAAGKAFEERRTGKPRKDFVSELFGKIVQRLDAHFAAPPAAAEPRRRPEIWQRDDLAREPFALAFVPPSGRTGTMNKLDDEAPDGERKDVVQFLLDWAREPNGPSCCALLGSSGIGKTTTSKAFAHRLLRDREADPSLPIPIYLDLRNLGEAAKQEPDLKTILHTVLRRSWQGGATDMPLEAEEVIRLVRQEAAIVIFDGLDEVLVHLSQQGGQVFTRELLRILPPGLWPGRRRPDEPGRPGRIMLTCRTHYFRSLRDQQTHLTLEDRDDVRDTDYRVFILLPFDDDQIRTYLTQTFPDRGVEPILETIKAVHSLGEMAARPYTLSVIARSLPTIERWQMEGRRVTGADLYRHIVQSWLEWDSGKHEFDIDHKQRIMEHVAAALWRSGGRTWTARQMEDWLAGFMDATPEVARHYQGKELDVLKKDLRTATFLVGGGRQPFQFAHLSLHEFFLAGYLLRALSNSRSGDWQMPKPSEGALGFLEQLIASEIERPDLATLAKSWLPFFEEA
jgi:hypothetical protein